MQNKIRICKVVFIKLLNSVKKEFERIAALEGDIPKGKAAEYYGFGAFEKKTQSSLMKSLLSPTNNKTLTDYIVNNKYQNISRKHLYNLNRDFIKLDSYDSLAVDGTFMEILSMYLNYTSFSHFLNTEVKEKIVKIQKSIINLEEGEISESELASQYIGFYYNYKNRSRTTLRLWINFFNKSNQGYPAKLTHIYNTHENNNAHVSYRGYGEDKSTCSFILLFDKKERPFTLMGFRGHFPTRDLKYIRYTASAISQDGDPHSFEVLFVKIDENSKNKSFDELLSTFPKIENIDFYLQTQRRNFRIPHRIINDITELKSKGTKANKIQNIKGQYRIWSLGYGGDLIQSKFIIYPDFRSDLYSISTNQNFSKQTCLINISLVKDKLCVSAHTEEGISILNYAIFDIDPNENKKYLFGVYCGIGLNGEAEFAAENLVVFKDSTQFEAKRISPEEISNLVRQNPWIKDALLETLFANKNFTERHSFFKKINRLRTIVIGTK